MAETRFTSGRLDSWKEIADYLRREVRTVMRWEQRGLPVHRVPGGKRQMVFAYVHEIDAWLNHQKEETAAPQFSEPRQEASECPIPDDAISHHSGAESLVDETSPQVESVGKESRLTATRKTTMNLLVIGILIIVSVAIWLLPPRTVGAVHPVSIQQLTTDGRIKGAIRSDGRRLYFTEEEGARSILASAPVTGKPITLFDLPFTNVSLQDLSNDRTRLLFFSYEGIVLSGTLWVIPTEGGTPKRVGEVSCSFARWSPDDRQIACASGTTITLLQADGSAAHTVATFAQAVGPLVWAPDGQSIRFILQGANHTFSQWEIKLDAGGTATKAQELSLGKSCCIDWTWTRDGKKFVYTEIDEHGQSHLRVQNSRFSDSYELPVEIGTLWKASSADTNNSLFVLIGTAFRGELLTLEQSGARPLIPGLSASFVSFSPDGKWITYANTEDQTLWRSRADGSEALQLTSGPMMVEVSSWSPDGKQIAFMGTSPGHPWRIYLIDRDGGTIHEVAEGDDSQGGPSWSPDGKVIVYGNVDCDMIKSCWIRRLDLHTGKTEKISGSNGFRTARWSPNGKYIAALKPQTRELMLFDVTRREWKSLAGSVTGDNINWSSDSQIIYVDSPRNVKPVIERVRVSDASREVVVSLDYLRKVPGTPNGWFGLTPQNVPIVSHMFTASEVYKLSWIE